MLAEFFQRKNLIVSRETISKFELYETLLRKWQKTINLVGPSTLDNIAEKHFLDSVQLMPFIPDTDITLVDMGSGAGFPGMVLAMMGVKNVHLIESDTRKSVFLQSVSRETETPVTVHNRRVEDCDIPDIDVVTARALAPLRDLLGMMSSLTKNEKAVGLFLKGQRAPEEIDDAKKEWTFKAEVFEGSGKIVRISELFHVKQFT